MNIQITGRHVKVTEAMREFAIEKVSSVNKYSIRILKVHILMDVQKDTHTCEINLEGKPLRLNATAKSKNMYDSISKCVEKIDHQIRNNKPNYHDKKHRMATKEFERTLVDKELDSESEEDVSFQETA